MEDPFASAERPWHPALDARHKLPSDLYYPLVDGFLQDERYAKWSAGYKPWQLHCFGAPGCGKTTFAAVAFNDLKRRYQGTRVRVACVYIRQGVSSDHPSLMEDLLACVYSQLSGWTDSKDSDSVQIPHDYNKACRDGVAYVERIRLIRTALHDLLLANEHSFFVLDGYDRLDSSAQKLLDRELENSHVRNLSLLVTRRSPSYRKPEWINTACDNCGKCNLNLFWQCQKCPKEDAPTFCYNCQEKAATCQKEGHSMTLAEPYGRVDMDIRRAYVDFSYDVKIRTPLEHFVARELAKETGRKEHEISEKLITDITDPCDGNINLAKLRLDDLDVEALEKADRVVERLPRGVVAWFDAEIERVKSQSPANRDLALKTIAAVADHKGSYMPVETLKQRIRDFGVVSPGLPSSPVPRVKDILSAANGLITLQAFDNGPCVACFDDTFKFFASENYNEDLYWAAKGLNTVTGEEPEVEPEPELEDAGDDMPNLTTSPLVSEMALGPKENIGPVVDEGYYSAPNSRQTSTNSVKTLRKYQDFGDAEVSHYTQTRITREPSEMNTSREDRSVVQTEAAQGHGLCSFCEEHILRSAATQGDHHSSLQALQKTETGGCIFCSDLYKDILTTSNRTAATKNLSWPCYSWTVRSNGRIRNTKESITVSFKPKAHPDHPSLTPLQGKRYHLLSSPDVGKIPTPEALGKRTDPNETLKNWLQTCNETHPNCYKYYPDAFVPTRLVDIDTGSPEIVRVVHTGKEGIKTKYGTLSHSWGPTKFLALVRDNEARLMGDRGLQMSELSRNFKEAISVARFIGLKYLWIDSLCIMQKSNVDDGDFESEGQLMHKVYRYSYCNIAIADSGDSEGGLFRPREPEKVIPARYKSDGKGKLDSGEWRVLSEDLWKQDLLGTKIYTRGWVFQERMLSPRILHFAAHQIFWDCGTLSACESLPSGLPLALDSISSIDRHWRARIQASSPSSEHSPSQDLSTEESSSLIKKPLIGPADDSIDSFWRTALLNYTSCNLTSQGDKTIAIWSIAKMVRDVIRSTRDPHEEYGGGLWQNVLEEQLAWHMRDCLPDTRLVELQLNNPSWSWASVKGPVVAHDRLVPERCYFVKNHDGGYLEFEVDEKNVDEEPKLKSRVLSMRGYVGKARLKAGVKSGLLGMDVLAGGEGGGEEADAEEAKGTFDIYLDEAIPGIVSSEITLEFIVLAATAESPDDDDHVVPFGSDTSEDEGVEDEGYDDVTTGGSGEEEADETEVEAEDLEEQGDGSEHGEQEADELDERHGDEDDEYGEYDASTTYTGTALLLIPHLDYEAQQQKGLADLKDEVSRTPADKPAEETPFGQLSLKDKKAKLQELIRMLAHRDKVYCDGEGIERRYRRLGAVEFWNVDVNTWKKMKSGGLVNILLE